MTKINKVKRGIHALAKINREDFVRTAWDSRNRTEIIGIEDFRDLVDEVIKEVYDALRQHQ